MKLLDLKKILDNLSEEELEQDLIYNSEDNSISGTVESFTKAEENLYYDCEDDPSTLKTRQGFKEDGYDDEDIDEFVVEIEKGMYYISF